MGTPSNTKLASALAGPRLVSIRCIQRATGTRQTGLRLRHGGARRRGQGAQRRDNADCHRPARVGGALRRRLP
eukprot:15475569-Alexandrium_andersonii.AAC.1